MQSPISEAKLMNNRSRLNISHQSDRLYPHRRFRKLHERRLRYQNQNQPLQVYYFLYVTVYYSNFQVESTPPSTPTSSPNSRSTPPPTSTPGPSSRAESSSRRGSDHLDETMIPPVGENQQVDQENTDEDTFDEADRTALAAAAKVQSNLMIQ